jgi:hypothetical protein
MCHLEKIVRTRNISDFWKIYTQKTQELFGMPLGRGRVDHNVINGPAMKNNAEVIMK